MDPYHQISILTRFCLEQTKEIEDQKLKISELRNEVARLLNLLSRASYSEDSVDDSFISQSKQMDEPASSPSSSSYLECYPFEEAEKVDCSNDAIHDDDLFEEEDRGMVLEQSSQNHNNVTHNDDLFDEEYRQLVQSFSNYNNVSHNDDLFDEDDRKLVQSFSNSNNAIHNDDLFDEDDRKLVRSFSNPNNVSHKDDLFDEDVGRMVLEESFPNPNNVVHSDDLFDEEDRKLVLEQSFRNSNHVIHSDDLFDEEDSKLVLEDSFSNPNSICHKDDLFDEEDRRMVLEQSFPNSNEVIHRCGLFDEEAMDVTLSNVKCTHFENEYVHFDEECAMMDSNEKLPILRIEKQTEDGEDEDEDEEEEDENARDEAYSIKEEIEIKKPPYSWPSLKEVLLFREKLVPVPLSPTTTLIAFEYRESSPNKTRFIE